jgi:hypothetical protein
MAVAAADSLAAARRATKLYVSMNMASAISVITASQQRSSKLLHFA